jgi:ABC-type lipoprotein release transport system permease subunit
MVGVWAVLAGTGFMNGFLVSYMSETINHDVSNIQVHHKQLSEDNDIKFFIPNAAEKAGDMRNWPEVKAVTSRILVNGMISSAKKASGVQIKGIDVENEKRVTALDSLIIDGAYFEGIKRNPVIIGSKLAEELNVKVRSKIVLTFSDVDGEMVSGAFRIVGIIKTSSIKLNELSAIVLAKDIAPLLGIENEYHEIAALTQSNIEESIIVDKYHSKYPDDLAQSWKEIAPNLAYMADMYGQMLYILMGIILLALVFGIVNTMLMAVLERIKELGMLMAVGMNKSKIFFMIVIETIYLGLVGTPLGLLFGYLHVSYYSKKGVDLTEYSEGLESFGYSTDLYPYLEPSVFLIVSTGIFFTAILGALYPAWKAIKLKPVEALHKI